MGSTLVWAVSCFRDRRRWQYRETTNPASADGHMAISGEAELRDMIHAVHPTVLCAPDVQHLPSQTLRRRGACTFADGARRHFIPHAGLALRRRFAGDRRSDGRDHSTERLPWPLHALDPERIPRAFKVDRLCLVRPGHHRDPGIPSARGTAVIGGVISSLRQNGHERPGAPARPTSSNPRRCNRLASSRRVYRTCSRLGCEDVLLRSMEGPRCSRCRTPVELCRCVIVGGIDLVDLRSAACPHGGASGSPRAAGLKETAGHVDRRAEHIA